MPALTRPALLRSLASNLGSRSVARPQPSAPRAAYQSAPLAARARSLASLTRTSARIPALPRPARRLYSQEAANDPSVPVKELSTEEYHRLSDETMDTLHEHLEAMCEDYGGGQWEVEYSSGVMSLALPHGTYVINKQPPNQQIWVSSPVSGPARFACAPDGSWVHFRRPGVTLGGLLGGELGECVREAGGTWEGIGIE